MEENKPETIKKVNFDGRLHYFNNLAKLKSELNYVLLIDDFVSAEKLLRLIIAEINDRVSDIEGTKDKLDKVSKFITPRFMTKYSGYIKKNLNSINYEINLKASHLMLPVSEEISGTDEDVIFGGV